MSVVVSGVKHQKHGYIIEEDVKNISDLVCMENALDLLERRPESGRNVSI